MGWKFSTPFFPENDAPAAKVIIYTQRSRIMNQPHFSSFVSTHTYITLKFYIHLNKSDTLDVFQINSIRFTRKYINYFNISFPFL